MDELSETLDDDTGVPGILGEKRPVLHDRVAVSGGVVDENGTEAWGFVGIAIEDEDEAEEDFGLALLDVFFDIPVVLSLPDVLRVVASRLGFFLFLPALRTVGLRATSNTGLSLPLLTSILRNEFFLF